jgi:hypothetical protein
MKFKSAALVSALLVSLWTGSSEAASLTYDLVLISTAGPENGTGSFIINGPVANTGLSVFTAGSGLTSLNFSTGGNNFALANGLSSAGVIYNNGNLITIAYAGELNGFTLDLGTIGLNYDFADRSDWRLDSTGTISASPVSAAPLPPAWTLMLIGLVGGGFVLRRRRNKLPSRRPKFS